MRLMSLSDTSSQENEKPDLSVLEYIINPQSGSALYLTVCPYPELKPFSHQEVSCIVSSDSCTVVYFLFNNSSCWQFVNARLNRSYHTNTIHNSLTSCLYYAQLSSPASNDLWYQWDLLQMTGTARAPSHVCSSHPSSIKLGWARNYT